VNTLSSIRMQRPAKGNSKMYSLNEKLAGKDGSFSPASPLS